MVFAKSAFALALLPSLVLADHHWPQAHHHFDPTLDVPFQFEKEHKPFFGCEPSLTVVPGTTVIHQTVTGPPPHAAPTGFPRASVVGEHSIDKWTTALTWEHQSPTTIAVPCPTEGQKDKDHHHHHHLAEAWTVIKDKFSHHDVTVNVPYFTSLPTPHHEHKVHIPTVTVLATASPVTVTRVHESIVTETVIPDKKQFCGKPVTTTIFPQAITSTVTHTVYPTPSVTQKCTRCSESHVIQGWNYQVMFDNNAEVYVNQPFPVVITIVGVYAPRTKFQVKVGGKQVGFTSEPTGDHERACAQHEPGEKCIANGASWGQWTLQPGFNTISIANVTPERGYFMYKVSVCN